ncbi:L-2-amino-thiazoline-4-carboxylic acid hydrolase [Clostridium estertheticum]|uniref:L-2-amino-thiazoline-4-carboxylic acid hydrolase n=1 Tax=Clostridium estertheticum TaxID=238834 RepID=UPI001C0D3564|nr:L-2-amino-thiazoline-4-carboxylic acid hydrolase [Clostridium estertheticum]MBU3185864.1 L-2-amino-thiazoline-4-carboxylic acid hydrolase [Clostridium estertheticum]
MIRNVSKINDKNTQDLRSSFEHRATWFYFLIDEAEKRGVDAQFARDAIYKCGCFHGENKFSKTDDIQEFAKVFAPDEAQKVFEMDVKSTPEELSIEFHYCPLVAAWEKLTGDEIKISKLCDIAMEGDRGVISKFDKFTFKLGNTIANGANTCQVSIRKIKE